MMSAAAGQVGFSYHREISPRCVRFISVSAVMNWKHLATVVQSLLLICI